MTDLIPTGRELEALKVLWQRARRPSATSGRR